MIELNSIHKQKLVFNGKKTRKTRAIRQEKTDLTPHKSVVLPKIWGLRLFERQTSVYLTCGYLYNKTKKKHTTKLIRNIKWRTYQQELESNQHNVDVISKHWL
jgi:hypothetical protein